MWSCDQSLVSLAFLERSYYNLNFFEGCSWFKFNNLGLALGIALNI